MRLLDGLRQKLPFLRGENCDYCLREVAVIVVGKVAVVVVGKVGLLCAESCGCMWRKLWLLCGESCSYCVG